VAWLVPLRPVAYGTAALALALLLLLRCVLRLRTELARALHELEVSTQRVAVLAAQRKQRLEALAARATGGQVPHNL